MSVGWPIQSYSHHQLAALYYIGLCQWGSTNDIIFCFPFVQNIMNSTALNSFASITAMRSSNSFLMIGFLNK